MIKISPSINADDKLENYIISQNKSKSAVIQDIVEIFYSIRLRTLNELKGKFTSRELTALIDIFNSHLCNWEREQKQYLIFGFSDACELEYTDKKWEIDRTEMSEKLQDLTEAQAIILIRFVKEFWEQKDPNRSIDDWVSQIAIAENTEKS